MNPQSFPIECIDDLNQLKDELQVVWCALTNPSHAEECVVQIAEHVNGIRSRLRTTIRTLEGAKK